MPKFKCFKDLFNSAKYGWNTGNVSVVFQPKYLKPVSCTDFDPATDLILVPAVDKLNWDYNFIIVVGAKESQGVYVVKKEDLVKCPKWKNWNKGHTHYIWCYYVNSNICSRYNIDIVYGMPDKILKKCRQKQNEWLKEQQEEEERWKLGAPTWFI